LPRATGCSGIRVMYQTGEGVPQDFVEAYKWFAIAARQGLPEAEQNLHKLALKMTSSQLAEALRRSREFLLQHHP
jgi:uncharacterized protein